MPLNCFKVQVDNSYSKWRSGVALKLECITWFDGQALRALHARRAPDLIYGKQYGDRDGQGPSLKDFDHVKDVHEQPAIVLGSLDSDWHTKTTNIYFSQRGL